MSRADQPHKLTFEAFVAKCTDFENPVNARHRGLTYSRPETAAAWNGSKSKVPIWCDAHAGFFVQQGSNHMNGQGCPKCGAEVFKEKRRKDDPIADFRAKHGDTYDYNKVDYINVQTKVEIICPTHGSFFQKPNNHLRGDGCPVCWENRRKAFGAQKTVDYKALFAERAARVHNGAYAILRLPEDSHDMALLSCPTHGEFEQKAFSHLDGHGCWSCGQNTNFAELEVAQFIKDLGVKVEHEDRVVLGGLHIDIWAPEKQIGVEYHGCYWHTEENVGNKHREKYERSVAAGIRLIQIFDFEWLEKREAVENRLRAIFAPEAAIPARKCELRETTRSQAKAFLRLCHTQGFGTTPAAVYGLWFEDELVACMLVGMNRYGKTGWEVLRYASKGRVQGGFSRLFKRFRDEHDPDVVTSYCDLRWGVGTVYEQAAFVLDGITPPEYFYVDKRGKKISRYTVQGRPSGITERAYAEEMGYKKVLTVGHQRWLWKRPIAKS